jgi:hypothetical protein
MKSGKGLVEAGSIGTIKKGIPSGIPFKISDLTF